MVLAYLLYPLVSKIERLELSRLLATLVTVIPVIVATIVLLILTLPIIGRDLYHFIDSLPLYVRRPHTLANSSSQPWVSKIIGEGLGKG
jgi:predicted PurR-regulated permease PerM